MKTLELQEMEIINGGEQSTFCHTVEGATLIYEVGVEAEFWNPVGWLSAGFLAVDVGCYLLD